LGGTAGDEGNLLVEELGERRGFRFDAGDDGLPERLVTKGIGSGGAGRGHDGTPAGVDGLNGEIGGEKMGGFLLRRFGRDGPAIDAGEAGAGDVAGREGETVTELGQRGGEFRGSDEEHGALLGEEEARGLASLGGRGGDGEFLEVFADEIEGANLRVLGFGASKVPGIEVEGGMARLGAEDVPEIKIGGGQFERVDGPAGTVREFERGDGAGDGLKDVPIPMAVGVADAGLVEECGVVEEEVDGKLAGDGLDFAAHREGRDAARGGIGEGDGGGEIAGGVESGKIARVDQADIGGRVGGESFLQITAVGGGIGGDGERDFAAGGGGEGVGLCFERPGFVGDGPGHDVEGGAGRDLGYVRMRDGFGHRHAVRARFGRGGERALVVAGGDFFLGAGEGEVDEEGGPDKGGEEVDGDGFFGHGEKLAQNEKELI
jgi:hypothetical protein